MDNRLMIANERLKRNLNSFYSNYIGTTVIVIIYTHGRRNYNKIIILL